jgi:hypothetical protein
MDQEIKPLAVRESRGDLIAAESDESACIIKLSRQLRLGPEQVYRAHPAQIRPEKSAEVPWRRD